VLAAQTRKGSRRQPCARKKMLMECGGAFKSTRRQSFGRRYARSKRLTRFLNPRTPQKSPGRFVPMLLEKRVERSAAQARHARDRSEIAKISGIAADPLHCLFKDRLRPCCSPIQRIRMAPVARPQSEAARLFRRLEKAHIFGLRPSRRARGQAVDTGRNNAGEELAIEFRISLEKPAVEQSLIPPAALRCAHASMLRAGTRSVFRI